MSSLLDIAKGISGSFEGSEKSVILDKEHYSASIDCSNVDTLILSAPEITIEANVPIITDGSKFTIKGTGNNVLKLITTETRQPCIGPKTNNHLSYDRWEVNDWGSDIESLTIDGCTVICQSKVPNFAIGTYGRDKTPLIVPVNGGSIECPEATGMRVRTYMPYVQGSTKLSVDCEYTILDAGNDITLGTKAQEVIHEMSLDNLRIDSRINYKTEPDDIAADRRFQLLGLDTTCMYDHYDVVKRHGETYLGAVFVGVPPHDESFLNVMKSMDHLGMVAEMQVDALKRAFAYIKLTGKEDIPEDTEAALKEIYKIRQVNKLRFPKEEDLEFWWQLIPVDKYEKGSDKYNEVMKYTKRRTEK